VVEIQAQLAGLERTSERFLYGHCLSLQARWWFRAISAHIFFLNMYNYAAINLTAFTQPRSFHFPCYLSICSSWSNLNRIHSQLRSS